MQSKDYYVATNSGEFNIVYVEGMNVDGSLNSDTPNHFNDVRMVIEVKSGRPEIVGRWEATTEPGSMFSSNCRLDNAISLG